MVPSVEYEERISRFGRKELLELWNGIKSGVTPDWPDGKALEYLILRAFQLGGAVVRWPYGVPLGDESEEVVEQIDGAVHVNGLHCLIESKGGRPVNIEPIAKLRNQLLRRPAGTIGVVFSRGGFTAPALKLAQFVTREGILLWNGDDIGYVLDERNISIIDALHLKYRACVEMANPYFSVCSEGVP